MPPHRPKGPSQRQLRVGEEIRHALSAIFMEGKLYDPDLMGVSMTVAEVRVSPDLKNATAFVMPLGGVNQEKCIQALNRIDDALRRMVTSRVKLRFSPQIRYELDRSFEVASRIETLLQQSKPTARDEEE